MKWIGQQIYDQISRFRNDVYLEDLSTTTETSVLVVDSDGKVSKSTSVAGDLTSIVAGTGLSGTSLTGPIPTLNVDASIPEITTLAGLTSIGTIATGVWNATKILSPKTTHVIHYPFKGYATGIASGNFQYSVNYQDAQSLFQLNFDYGDTVIADGNLPDVSDWFRSSGTVMPRAVTATRVYGWLTCPTTNNVTIALCKITPTRNDNSAVVPIVVATTVIAAIDNDKMDFFNITASDAGAGTGSIVTSAIAQGDILMPFVISPNTKTTFFNLTLEVEA